MTHTDVETWVVRVPFSIYLGWITVATITNVTSLLDYLNWDGWGISPEAWAVVMLVAGAAIVSAVSLTRGDVDYVLVIVWALTSLFSIITATDNGGNTGIAPASKA